MSHIKCIYNVKTKNYRCHGKPISQKAKNEVAEKRHLAVSQKSSLIWRFNIRGFSSSAEIATGSLDEQVQDDSCVCGLTTGRPCG